MAKNLWNKTVDKDHAYLTFKREKWTWYVLKAYKSRKAEKKDAFARWLCLVVTPFTGEEGEMGDTYVANLPLTSVEHEILDKREKLEELDPY